ncbi:hypothetical protein H7J87_12140 [Mycolicibacterium wolinskyi]|uniref:Trypsin n=1 Tax=Mycolicibacterium wolinskyi TaxID=59750 RepID=A0A1X2FJ85_9MYCO|nr:MULTISPECIES: hypothetical protein [Mycolicibacterium]MCV7286082.1 hypothetical protein [Mycolicibacterium wolinskyi]MCV7296278.1 hypothetical protein [Mycolicibacterium goodii]ORX18505.1 hypothetical protein AWC31_14480 [Mycolicibacterium wolinskyi]
MKLSKLMAAAATTVAVLAAGLGHGRAAADVNEWTSFAGLTPGTTIGQRIPQKNGIYVCTLAFIAREKATYAKKAITAGHCDHTAEGQATVFYTESSDPDTARPLGTYSRSNARGADTGTSSAGLPAFTDAGIIDMNPGIRPSSYDVAGVYRVTRTLRPDPPLAPGIEVCKFGARTGETCGPVISADSDRITARLRLVEGDSGAPAYIKTGGDTITAVGMLSGHLVDDEDTAVIYYLFPVIDSLGLQICGDC